MSGTWCSVELKKAFVGGHVISNIHAGFKYKVINGLMNTYVDLFYKNLRLVIAELRMLPNVTN